MKEMMLLLFILIQVQVTFEVVLENELIGTWKIEKVQITRPWFCIRNDINQITGSTFTFTDEHLLLITSNNKWFSVDNDDQLYWFIEDEHLVIKSKNTLEVFPTKITFERDQLILSISNLVTIILKKS
ncbi:hypothetical protein A9200_08085 [Maribacter hydrothermalis]|uniref:Lipocalin-like domain-containing protein n=2 Tax=Maribacter hydrothermalis TaxID=1836467 RepID=A0A1B7Z4E6_9FLAO|nr:hypothetical protein BTR34_08335 [Maribacter hydrothermalis]OBR37591.1 hypothetical protein A9200_08085 [Maribacter hydrothermalis]